MRFLPAPEYGYLSPLYVGPFDYAVIALMAAATLWCVWRRVSVSFGCVATLAAALVFGIVLPELSCWFEVARTRRPPGVMVDNFELLYIYLRYPLYWAMFAGQLLFWAWYTPSKGEQAQA